RANATAAAAEPADNCCGPHDVGAAAAARRPGTTSTPMSTSSITGSTATPAGGHRRGTRPPTVHPPPPRLANTTLPPPPARPARTVQTTADKAVAAGRGNHHPRPGHATHERYDQLVRQHRQQLIDSRHTRSGPHRDLQPPCRPIGGAREQRPIQPR